MFYRQVEYWFRYGLFCATWSIHIMHSLRYDRYVICEFWMCINFQTMAPTLTMVELLISNLVSNYAENCDKTNYGNYFAIKLSDFDYGWIKLLATFYCWGVYFWSTINGPRARQPKFYGQVKSVSVNFTSILFYNYLKIGNIGLYGGLITIGLLLLFQYLTWEMVMNSLISDGHN